LGARALLLLSDVPGVVLGGRIAHHVTRPQLDRAIASPEVQGGMRPKLLAARAALDGGVRRVHVAGWSGRGTLRALLDGAAGTTLTSAREAAHD
jgi:acetylglutamate kinase